jgi:hypothetical protein
MPIIAYIGIDWWYSQREKNSQRFKVGHVQFLALRNLTGLEPLTHFKALHPEKCLYRLSIPDRKNRAKSDQNWRSAISRKPA